MGFNSGFKGVKRADNPTATQTAVYLSDKKVKPTKYDL